MPRKISKHFEVFLSLNDDSFHCAWDYKMWVEWKKTIFFLRFKSLKWFLRTVPLIPINVLRTFIGGYILTSTKYLPTYFWRKIILKSSVIYGCMSNAEWWLYHMLYIIFQQTDLHMWFDRHPSAWSREAVDEIIPLRKLLYKRLGFPRNIF